MERLRNITRTPYAWLFVGFATGYACLLSRRYIGDGLRYLPGAIDPYLPRPSGASHLLYPWWTWLVWRVGLLLGLEPVDRIGVVTLLQAANGLLAAAGLATLAWLLRSLGVRALVAGLASACAGLSHAYMLHATDMTEPMPSVPLMLLGLAVAVRRPDSLSALVAGGALVGFAAGFYLTALGSLAFASAVLAWRSPGRPRRACLLRPTVFAISAIAGFGAILSIAALLVRHGVWGEASPASYGVSTASGMFGRFHPRHLVGGIFGVANAWAPLSGWIGLSRIRELPAWQAAYDLLLAGAALAWLLALVRSVKRRYREIEPPIARAAVAGGFLWLTGVWLIASAWDATYEKFWIGGVIAAVIVLALVGEAYLAKREAGSPGPVRSLIANAVAVPLALLLLLSLSAGAVPRRFSRNVGLATAQQLASHVGSGDLLVAAGWDAPSVYLKLLVSPDVQVFSFVDEAVRVGRDPERTLEALAAAVRAAHERQGTVYFLGLLDVTRIDWEWFFGRRLGIPHAVLDEYRLGAEPVAMLAAPGGILALKRLVF